MSELPEALRARMLDYLYGELSAEARADFEAALRASEPARRELEALEKTLGLTRAALLPTSQDVPPERVKRALLEAAAQAAAHSAAQPARARVASAAWGQRAWAWLRAPWLFPALGAAGACALLVLFLEGRSAQEAPAREAQVAPAASPVPRSPDALAASEAAPPAAPAPALEHTIPAQRRRARERTWSEPPPAPSGAPRERTWSRPPPASAPSAQPEHAPSERVGRARTTDGAEDFMADRGEAEARTPRGAAPAPKASARGAGAAEAAADPPLGRDALVRRARAHAAQGRYARAASDYRLLLARFPDDAERASWQRALAALPDAAPP